MGKRLIMCKKGFTYTELMIGIFVLLISLTGLVKMLRYSAMNRVMTDEMTSMQMVAQNMAEVYKTSAGDLSELEAAMKSEAMAEGFENNKLIIEQFPDNPELGVTMVIITVKPRVVSPQIVDYVLVFYSFDKVNIAFLNNTSV